MKTAEEVFNTMLWPAGGLGQYDKMVRKLSIEAMEVYHNQFVPCPICSLNSDHPISCKLHSSNINEKEKQGDSEINLDDSTPSDKDKILALEKIVAIKEKERKEWADMCIRKQARIEELEKAAIFYLEEIGRLSNRVCELSIVDSFREGNGDIA
ncbi:MAG TPA: hypothetical protein PLJ18_11990 [Niabella sp.]|nr:hypothetical protein [Niabella sp.]